LWNPYFSSPVFGLSLLEVAGVVCGSHLALGVIEVAMSLVVVGVVCGSHLALGVIEVAMSLVVVGVVCGSHLALGGCEVAMSRVVEVSVADVVVVVCVFDFVL
jgi:hypothetical protein